MIVPRSTHCGRGGASETLDVAPLSTSSARGAPVPCERQSEVGDPTPRSKARASRSPPPGFLKAPNKAPKAERREARMAAPRRLPLRGGDARGLTCSRRKNSPCAGTRSSRFDDSVAGPDFSSDREMLRLAGNGCEPREARRKASPVSRKGCRSGRATIERTGGDYKQLAAFLPDARRGMAATWP